MVKNTQFRFNMQFQLMVFVFGCLMSLMTVRGNEVNLKKVLNNVNHIMTTYNNELDKAVPFKEMRASLVVLDSLAQNYHGECSQDISNASKLGYKAAEKYYQAIDTVFRWCAKAEMYCNCIVVKDPAGNPLSSDDPLYVISALLVTGLEEVVESITILEAVRDTLTEMKRELRPVPSKLNSELDSIRWDYTWQRQERVSAVDKENKRREAEAALKASYKLTLGILGGPIGVAIGLYAALNDLDIPRAVLNQDVEATKAQQLAVTVGFMTSLIKAVESTIETINNVKQELRKEITNVKALKGSVDGQLMIVMDMKDFPESELKLLKGSVHEFIARHGGDSHRSRERREITTQGRNTWEAISNVVDEYLNATATQREVEYWMLQPLEMSKMENVKAFQ